MKATARRPAEPADWPPARGATGYASVSDPMPDHATRTETEQATERWRWLDDVLRQLKELGLDATVYDTEGRRVHEGMGPGPFFKRVWHSAAKPCELGVHVRQFLEDNLAGDPSRCLPVQQASHDTFRCIPGAYCIMVPIQRRRRRVGVISVCLVCRDIEDSEELAQFCQVKKLDRELLLRLARQQARFDSTQLDSVRQIVRLLLEQAVESHQAEDEITELSHHLTTTYEELSLLYKISADMKVTEKPGDYLRSIGYELLEVMNVDALAVRYFHPDQPLMSEHINVGVELTSPSVEQTMWDELLKHFDAHPIEMVDNDVSDGVSASPLRSLADHDRVRQIAAVPLLRNEKLLGAMVAMNKLDDDFDSNDLKLMKSIGEEAGVFLENWFLYEDLHQLLIGMLRALTSSIDAKDPYTCGHSERVAAISSRIAESMGLDQHVIGRVYLSGLLHDIGKIGVPEAVLTKPGRLTKAEFEIMKKHPEIGAKIISGIKQVEDLIPGVLCHHERMDGRGYPQGLAGHEIPLFGRIIGLADCFDAMTSNRTYRRALPLEVTLTEIRRFAGTQFDPAIVEAFFRLDPASLIEQTREIDPLDPLDNMVRKTSVMMTRE